MFFKIIAVMITFLGIIFWLVGRQKVKPVDLHQDAKPSGDQDENKDALDEKQAAVIAATWTMLNPPSS